MGDEKVTHPPTIAISKILESVILGMRIAVYGSSWSRARQ